MIDIIGIDKVDLLIALHANTRTVGMGVLHETGSLDRETAQQYIERGRIDYCNGRPIKADLRKDAVDEALYDRDAGRGTFKRVVEELRTR